MHIVPDFPLPDITRPVILSQEESSPQGPETPEPPHQRARRTQTGWFRWEELGWSFQCRVELRIRSAFFCGCGERKKEINKKSVAVYADVMPSLLCKQSSCLFMSAVGGQVLQGPSLSRPKPTPMRWSLSGTGLPMSCWDPQSTPRRSTCGTSLCKTPHPLS